MDKASMTLTEALTAIRSRLEKATPGPWQLRPDIGTIHDAKGEAIQTAGEYFKGETPYSNAELIAHAPTDIAKLLRVVELLREELTEIKDCGRCGNCSMDADMMLLKIAKLFEEGE